MRSAVRGCSEVVFMNSNLTAPNILQFLRSIMYIAGKRVYGCSLCGKGGVSPQICNIEI